MTKMEVATAPTCIGMKILDSGRLYNAQSRWHPYVSFLARAILSPQLQLLQFLQKPSVQMIMTGINTMIIVTGIHCSIQ